MGQHQHHMSSQPELIYFGGPGRAELTRRAFKVGEVAFTDTRHEMADWPAIKADPTSIPAQCFGSMPCIHHDDLILAQSQACAVYAAELGIYQQGVLGDAPSVNRATDLMASVPTLTCSQPCTRAYSAAMNPRPPVWKPFQTRQLHSWQGWRECWVGVRGCCSSVNPNRPSATWLCMTRSNRLSQG